MKLRYRGLRGAGQAWEKLAARELSRAGYDILARNYRTKAGEIDLVAKKASPAEADAYRNMLVAIAQKAAEASKEGGFLGFGGVRVSDAVRALITEVRRAAGLA